MAAPDPDAASTPSFALAMLPENDLLPRALGKIRDARVIDTLGLELASLANKVVVADRLLPDEPEVLRFAVGKMAAYVNLGLDLLSRGSSENTVKIIEEVFLEHLFRLAHTQISRLKGRLQKEIQRGWLSRWPNGHQMSRCRLDGSSGAADAEDAAARASRSRSRVTPDRRLFQRATGPVSGEALP